MLIERKRLGSGLRSWLAEKKKEGTREGRMNDDGSAVVGSSNPWDEPFSTSIDVGSTARILMLAQESHHLTDKVG